MSSLRQRKKPRVDSSCAIACSAAGTVKRDRSACRARLDLRKPGECRRQRRPDRAAYRIGTDMERQPLARQRGALAGADMAQETVHAALICHRARLCNTPPTCHKRGMRRHPPRRAAGSGAAATLRLADHHQLAARLPLAARRSDGPGACRCGDGLPGGRQGRNGLRPSDLQPCSGRSGTQSRNRRRADPAGGTDCGLRAGAHCVLRFRGTARRGVCRGAATRDEAAFAAHPSAPARVVVALPLGSPDRWVVAGDRPRRPGGAVGAAAWRCSTLFRRCSSWRW